MKTNDKPCGWNGKLLNVDLTNRKVEEQRIEASILEAYLGGRGLNMWILHHNLTSSVSPFSPENLLVSGQRKIQCVQPFAVDRTVGGFQFGWFLGTSAKKIGL
jgi:hypothetical protein